MLFGGPGAVEGGGHGTFLVDGGDLQGAGPGGGVGRRHLGLLDVGQHGAQAAVLGAHLAGVSARLVPGHVERGDAQQGQDQLATIGRALAGKGVQLLLFGENRRPEGTVVHAQDRVHVAAGVPHSLSHGQAVAMGLGPHGGIDAADGPADKVDVALVLEGHLGHAFTVGARRRDLLLASACLAPQDPQDGLRGAWICRPR